MVVYAPSAVAGMRLREQQRILLPAYHIIIRIKANKWPTKNGQVLTSVKNLYERVRYPFRNMIGLEDWFTCSYNEKQKEYGKWGALWKRN